MIPHRTALLFVLVLIALLGSTARGQSILSGRILGPRHDGGDDRIAYSAEYVFANQPGSDNEALSFRTWETAPTGWFQLKGSAGNYTLVCTNPASFMRPIVRTNQFVRDGEKLDRVLTPRADYAVFDERTYDTKPARAYFQVFTAKGTSVTHVGFRLAHDGVDGGGPDKQDVAVTIHRKPEKPDAGKETPEHWPQVGAAGIVRDVDSGGAKNYIWSAGWASGEVKLEPGEMYAVCVAPAKKDGVMQSFWRDAGRDGPRCYRVGADGAGAWVNQSLWMNIAGDGDGLVIPYPKRIHKQFGEFTKYGPKWSQTYVAQGRGLCSVVLYAAVSGSQPPLRRQRCVVRLREGGPNGKIIGTPGTPKIAVGNGNYTGDASWGVFGVVFAPGEAPVEPGKSYTIEFESLESFDTLDGYVNIKGVASNNRPGFNPYRKQPGDEHRGGKAYFNGDTEVDYNLDMQVIEYENAPRGAWSDALGKRDFLANGDMEEGPAAEDDAKERAAHWGPFIADKLGRDDVHRRVALGAAPKNHILRIGGAANDAPIDAGFVQRSEELDRAETYRVTARLRCSWPFDDEHACQIGYDATGQTDDPSAKTIVWQSFPKVHGSWIDFTSEPIRPAKGAISVWLRGRTSAKHDLNHAFKADFDDVVLRQVESGVPK